MTPQELIQEAFHEISRVAFDPDSQKSPQVALDRICGMVYSVEQTLDHLSDRQEEQTWA